MSRHQLCDEICATGLVYELLYTELLVALPLRHHVHGQRLEKDWCLILAKRCDVQLGRAYAHPSFSACVDVEKYEHCCACVVESRFGKLCNCIQGLFQIAAMFADEVVFEEVD